MARDPLAWTSFQDRTKAYGKQRDLVRKLKDWIAANVSSHYQELLTIAQLQMTK